MRQYAVSFNKVEVSAAIDLFEINPTANKPIELAGLFLGQSSDFGDAASEVIPYHIIRGHNTSGSGGAAATARALDPSDTAFGGTVETNNTTIASAGTPIPIHSGVFNVAVGEQIWFPENFGPRSNAGVGLIVVRLMTAPADALTLSGTLYFKEV